MKSSERNRLAVGLVGLQDHGLTERSIALDILASIVLQSDHQLAFVMDASFDPLEEIFSCIRESKQLDLLAVSLRPESAILISQLQDALHDRNQAGLSRPYLALGGQTAQCAPDLLHEILPDALVFTQEAEAVFPNVLEVLSAPPVGGREAILREIERVSSEPFFQIPVHLSTEQAIDAGGTVWVESSRGCQLNCAFCGLSNERVSSDWRLRDLGELFDELQYITERWGIITFSLADFSAFETEDSIKAFLDATRERNLSMSFRCDLRLGTARRMMRYLPALREAGLKQVFVGIESVVPKEQRLYGKLHSGYDIIRFMKSIGIRVVGGFITLQPLATREELYQQVVGLKEHGILNILSTPLKTIRVYRGTRYEKLCRSKGVLGEINPDLLTYQYRCADPYVDVVRQVIQFFDTTLKKVYFNNYVENMLRLADLEDLLAGIEVLSSICRRVQETDYWLLHELATVMLSAQTIEQAREKAFETGLRFNEMRRVCYQTMAQDYESLLEAGFPYYREDFQTFIEKHGSIEEFHPEVIE